MDWKVIKINYLLEEYEGCVRLSVTDKADVLIF